MAQPVVVSLVCSTLVFIHFGGFNGSVNIPESCDFRSQFDPLNIICKSFS